MWQHRGLQSQKIMQLFAVLVLLAYTVCVGIVSAQRPEGVCNVRQCGCPPYWHHWCTKDNAKVHHHECQESPRICEYYCGEEWCHGATTTTTTAMASKTPTTKTTTTTRKLANFATSSPTGTGPGNLPKTMAKAKGTIGQVVCNWCHDTHTHTHTHTFI